MTTNDGVRVRAAVWPAETAAERQTRLKKWRTRLQKLAERKGRDLTREEILAERRILTWMHRKGLARSVAVRQLAMRDADAEALAERSRVRRKKDLHDYFEREGREFERKVARLLKKGLSAKEARRIAAAGKKKAEEKARAALDALDISWCARKARQVEWGRRLSLGLIPLEMDEPKDMDWTPTEADINAEELARCRAYREQHQKLCAKVRAAQMRLAYKDMTVEEWLRVEEEVEDLEDRIEKLRTPWAGNWWEHHSYDSGDCDDGE